MLILIVDDNEDFCTTMADLVRSFGYEYHIINTPEETISFIEKNNKRISVVLLDIEFGPDAAMNGIDVLENTRRKFPALPVIMVTGKGTIDTAVRATKLGAINFIEKSILSKDKVKEIIASAVDLYNVKGDAREIQKFLESNGIIGKSKPMLELGDSVIRFGRTDLNVLISGETGTGKKLVAQAIHNASRRLKYPFIIVDIPNIPRELFQSELFGYNKGAFSGAIDTRKGLFHKANKGTLFLDEIGDLSQDLQASLFIPIEEKLIRRVGSTENEDIDVRFITATDKDLIFAMKEAKFREQLYHRLRECEIHIPPLRDRREDIPEIIEYYLIKHNKEFNDSKIMTPSAVDYLTNSEWRGNVRELASVIRVALQTSLSEEIEISDLHKILSISPTSPITDAQAEAMISANRTLKEDLADLDRKKIETTLQRTNGNVSKAAAVLAVSRETLHNKIRRYGINTQLFRVKK